jgi:hypothetical protein
MCINAVYNQDNSTLVVDKLSVLPGKTNFYSLGSDTYRWAALYLGSGGINTNGDIWNIKTTGEAISGTRLNNKKIYFFSNTN